MRPRQVPLCWLQPVALGFALSVAVGCSRAPEHTTVKGTVTYKGTPLTHGMIGFHPTSGVPLGAPISAAGTYESQLPPGQYDVTVNAPPKLPAGFKEGDPLPQVNADQIPVQYSRPETSNIALIVESENGAQAFDITIE